MSLRHVPGMTECEVDNGGCGALHCINQSGRGSCGCRTGYKRSADGRSCIGKKLVEEGSNSKGTEHTILYTLEFIQKLSLLKVHSPLTTSTLPPHSPDINECEHDNGGCDHSCQKFERGFACNCYEGYEAISGGAICQGKGLADYRVGGCVLSYLLPLIMQTSTSVMWTTVDVGPSNVGTWLGISRA